MRVKRRGPGRPALNPSGGNTAPLMIRLSEKHHADLRRLIASGRGKTLAGAIRLLIEESSA